MDSPQNIISFCTGYGGLELGLERAGVDVRPVCYLEIEAYVQALLVKEIEEGRMAPAPIWTDLKTFDASSFRGKVDGVTCGYPCQPFSAAGKRLGEKDPRHLWLKIREHINTIGARWVFAENVYGHLSLGLPTVFSDLEEDGYRVEAGIFSAEEVGAPHQRKRVFILGYSEHDRLHGSEIRRGSEKNCNRSQKGEKASKQSEGTSGRENLQNLSGAKLFPARPNQEQYEWEPPRTIESGLGRSSDGSDHRIDRLRLLGNGVVPQTAELAWKTLWRKMNER